MKLVHPLFSNPIRFRENRIPVLVLENPAAFRSLYSQLMAQSEGGEGSFVLSVNDVCLNANEHLNMVFDYFHLHTLEKRVQTKAIAALLHTAGEELAHETMQLSHAMQQYLGKLATLAEFPIAYENSENLSNILKAMDVRVALEDMPPPEALYERLCLLHSLAKNQCFVLVQAHAFFSTEELAQLFKMTAYKKIYLMLLESRAPEEPLPQEDILLFDSDLCELSLDSSSPLR